MLMKYLQSYCAPEFPQCFSLGRFCSEIKLCAILLFALTKFLHFSRRVKWLSCLLVLLFLNFCKYYFCLLDFYSNEICKYLRLQNLLAETKSTTTSDEIAKNILKGMGKYSQVQSNMILWHSFLFLWHCMSYLILITHPVT